MDANETETYSRLFVSIRGWKYEPDWSTTNGRLWTEMRGETYSCVFVSICGFREMNPLIAANEHDGHIKRQRLKYGHHTLMDTNEKRNLFVCFRLDLRF